MELQKLDIYDGNGASIILVVSSTRSWGDEDQENFEQLSKKMRCEIIFQSNDFNLDDLKQVRQILKGEKYMNKSIDHFNYLIVFVACHGNQKDQIYDCNNEIYSLRNLYNAPIGIKILQKIPKIFLLNHCRGQNEIDLEQKLNSKSKNDIEPKVPNTLLVYASSQNHVAYGSVLSKLAFQNFDFRKSIIDSLDLQRMLQEQFSHEIQQYICRKDCGFMNFFIVKYFI